jgi:hypothetical protein
MPLKVSEILKIIEADGCTRSLREVAISSTGIQPKPDV